MPEIVGFLKFVGEIQQLVRKHSQKNNQNVICPIQKQGKTLRNYPYLAKTTLVVNPIFYKLILFESLIKFPEPAIELITGIFDFQK